MKIKGLVYIDKTDKDYCDVTELAPNWENVLSHYMETHYLRCIKYDVHHSYYISIDYLRDNCKDHDTSAVLNTANVTIDSIDYIVNSIMIRFKDESSRDLVFSVLKGKVA